MNARLTIKFVAAVFLFAALQSCALHDPVEEDYFDTSNHIAGGEPPEKPSLTYITDEWKFTYVPSIDPDTGKLAEEFVLFYYYNYDTSPVPFYNEDDIVFAFTPQEPYEIYFTSPITRPGRHYYYLAAYDGYRFSELSEPAIIPIP